MIKRTNFYKFTGGSFTKIVVIQWCQLFGNKSEQIHWSKLHLPEDFPIFDRQSILNVTGFDDSKWEDYHKDMRFMRDKFFGHFDMTHLRGHIPSFEPALKMLLAYRQHLCSVIKHINEHVQGKFVTQAFDDNDILIEKINNELRR